MNRIKALQLCTFVGLPLLAFSNLSQAAGRIGYHGMFCQPRDAAQPFQRDPVRGIVNPSLDTSTTTATYDCPVQLATDAGSSIKSARVTVIENSIGNLDCMLITKSSTGGTISAQQRVAPAGNSPNPYVLSFGAQPIAVDGHALITCRVPPNNLGDHKVPSGVISYSITQ